MEEDALSWLIVGKGPLTLALPVQAVARLADSVTAEPASAPGRAGVLIKNEFVQGVGFPGLEGGEDSSATWLIIRGENEGVVGALAVDKVHGIEKAADVPSWRGRLAALTGGTFRGGFISKDRLCLIPDLARLSPVVSS